MKSVLLRIAKAIARAILNTMRRLLGMAPLGPDTETMDVDVADPVADGAVDETTETVKPAYSSTLAARIRLAAELRIEDHSVLHLFGRDQVEIDVKNWAQWLTPEQAGIVLAATDEAILGHVGGELIAGVPRVSRIAVPPIPYDLDPAPAVALDPVRPDTTRSMSKPGGKKSAAIRALEAEDVGDDMREYWAEFLAERLRERSEETAA